jgi:hypothetical protein
MLTGCRTAKREQPAGYTYRGPGMSRNACRAAPKRAHFHQISFTLSILDIFVYIGHVLNTNEIGPQTVAVRYGSASAPLVGSIVRREMSLPC